jgi:hypothetical protein
MHWHGKFLHYFTKYGRLVDYYMMVWYYRAGSFYTKHKAIWQHMGWEGRWAQIEKKKKKKKKDVRKS